MTRPLRFPNESDEYDAARDRLLDAERELRRSVEAVAAARRDLPPGGLVPEDYEFVDARSGSPVRMSELFTDEHNTLVLYCYMFGPAMDAPCTSCTSILDALDGTAPHLEQRVNFAVVAQSAAPRIAAVANERGWRHLRLLSSAGNAFPRDYLAEGDDGDQRSLLQVFRRDSGGIRHFWSNELLFVDADEGQEPRHLDPVWPLWNVLDVTPEGRGADWEPSLRY